MFLKTGIKLSGSKIQVFKYFPGIKRINLKKPLNQYIIMQISTLV